MSLETIDDLCQEILHLSWILEEMHHYTDYDLEKIRYQYHKKIIELQKELTKITNEKWFKAQTESDRIIIGEKI